MRISSFYSFSFASPFLVLSGNGEFVYSNSIFNALFGRGFYPIEDTFFYGKHKYGCESTSVSLRGNAYTVRAFTDITSEGDTHGASGFNSLIGFVTSVSHGGKIRKAPCGMRYLISMWIDSIVCEFDDIPRMVRCDKNRGEMYSSLNAQGFFVVLGIVYKAMLIGGKVTITILEGNDHVCIDFTSATLGCDAIPDAFIRDLLYEIARASGFEIDILSDGGVRMIFKRFSAKTFTAFSPAKEFAAQALSIALNGIL